MDNSKSKYNNLTKLNLEIKDKKNIYCEKSVWKHQRLKSCQHLIWK